MFVSVALVVGVALSAAAGIAAPASDKGDYAAQQKRYAEKIEKAKGRFDRVVTQKERDIAASNLAKKLGALGLDADATPAEYFAAMEMPMPGPGDVPDYSGMTPNWAYTKPLRKFVDGLPGLGSGNANNLGQYLSVGKPDTVTYPGSDYYEIELQEYTEQMHSDLPPTTLRGYVQVNNGTDAQGSNTLAPDPIHYLGPTIIASKDRPVRIKFINKLPTGADGDLFIPVDTSVMGAGMGPLMMDVPAGQPMNYTENRATLHLHGGRTPWISDGTPHQWITPAGENTPYPKGVSVVDVPDMAPPEDGAMTFYYSNAQSARLMFYHDHSFGITRLNVYAGEAAGYIIEDDTEKKLVADGTIPAEQIPLIIQDKTFVDADTIGMTDPTWNWGTGMLMDGKRMPVTGDLWMAHVYMPNQNPYDISGYNAMGRWHYGPWFWPPVVAEQGPIPNPYYISPTETPGQPPEIPGVPHPSMGMESFFDTPLVNGTAYPVLEVDPKSYRFRVLNAANDRFWNLQLYQADPAAPTEVRMVPAEASIVGAYDGWEADGRVGGLPDPTLVGPDMIQIGTEGGFLPSPVVLKSAPIQWNTSVVDFNVGNVDGGTLMLGPAERADVIVDFSAFAGQTLILYNDAPAPWPAVDSRYDYYTGNEDLTDAGGHAPTLAGYGPNTRTIMQIKVAAAPAAEPFDLAALEAAFAGPDGVFTSSQEDIIVAQQSYSSAYGTAFSGTWPYWGIVRIFDKQLTFKTVDGTVVTLPLEAKAIQDEMGETFDKMYGRMAGKLGLELPNTIAGLQNFMLYDYGAPPTELVDSSVTGTQIGSLDDGTQIWKITQNGVDTHPMHFHLFEVQLLNRVAWDGKIMLPEPNELGWKDTVKVNPLEDTVVALRPVVPEAPFDLPNSVRPLDPTMPLGAVLWVEDEIFDPAGEPVFPVINKLVNFGYEYMWHCHILSHEEMDMMRPISIVVKPKAPTDLAAALAGMVVNLSWVDNALNETGFVIERASDPAFTLDLVAFEVGENVTSYADATAAAGQTYYYRVFAKNVVGDGTQYPLAGPDAIGFPTRTAVSELSNAVSASIPAGTPPAAPTNLSATLQAGPQVSLSWTDNANNETGFVIQRSVNGGEFSDLATRGPRGGTGGVTFVDVNVLAGNTYAYQVAAVNGDGPSAWSNTATVSLLAPLAPSNLSGTAFRQGNGPNTRISLTWVDNANNETGFTIQRATNAGFTAGVVNTNVGANTTAYTTGNLPRNTTYWFRIRANNNVTGPSAWSDVFSITTP
jgi:FtsP/CotA-like multicopper oxidase with cupredoxin domain